MLVIIAGLMILFQASYLLQEREQPEDAVSMLVLTTPGGVQYERASVRPLSEFKYHNVVPQRYDYSCGSAALTTLMNHYLDVPISEAQAMEGMLQWGDKEQIIRRRGFSMLDMKRYVTALGYDSGGFRADVEALAGLEHPAIVPIHWGGFDHFVVLRRVAAGRVFLADPAMGNLSMSLERFREVWEPNVLFMVYPGRQPAVNGLALTEADLRIIDDTTLRRTALLNHPSLQLPMTRAVDTASGQYLYYRP